MSLTTFSAVRFDGRHAEAVPVIVHVDDGDLVVETVDGTLVDRSRLDRTIVSEPLERAPRVVWLPGGAALEVPDADRAFARTLTNCGVRSSIAVRLQQRWPAVLAALAVIVAVLGLFYFKGLPATARWLAFKMPPRLEERMGEQVLGVLDKHYLRPSGLDVERRRRIAERLSVAAAATAPGVRYRLEFRAAGNEGVNALTLPGGIILVLDGLVRFAGDDDALLGVLGHELGHVVHKHSVRQVLQSVGVGAVAGLLWGDFSGVAASVPIVFGMLSYSREFEREADEFAIAFLRAQRLSARPLYRFFVNVHKWQGRPDDGRIPDFLATHPSTEERLDRLRREIR
jgi:Zn-dependent protease with chaperone function